ncbi:MAG: hypothetical protein ACRDTH_15505 [Pseudonocardiaceae bacterium]
MDGQDGNPGRSCALAVVREHGGIRNRTVDEHMFTVGASSFRLQLFTAPGLRPVAVATQTDREGASLMNRAERYVEAVWQRHCPDEPEPPIFIAHQLLGDRDLGFQHYDFTVTSPYAVASPPNWGRMLTLAELTELVSGPVDAERGTGYVEPVPPEEPHMRLVTTAVVTLPRPDLDGEPPCMPAGTPWWRRLGRQAVPRRRGRSCCWYHEGDWHQASRTAIQMLRRADAELVDDDEHQERLFAALKLSRAEGLTGWQYAAVESLLLHPIQPEREIGYTEGRHRSQAMLDAGVRRTLVARWVMPAPSGRG